MISTIYSLLQKQSFLSPDKTAIIDGTKSYSYNELLKLINAHAGQLLSHGVNRGDRVAVHLPKSIEEVISIFAISAVGAIIVNINYQLVLSQVHHIIADAKCEILITHDNKVRRTEGLLDLTKVIISIGTSPPEGTYSWTDKGELSNLTPNPASISNDIAALLYTSGSTGRPKGVAVTHRNLLDGANVVVEYLGLKENDRILSVPPFNFDYGLNQLISSISIGATLVLQKVAMATEILKSTKQFHISVLPLVAPSWVQFLRLLSESGEKIYHLRIATNTGGKIPMNLLDLVPDLLKETQFFLMYGLTEAFRSTYLPPELFKEKKGAIGKAVPDNEIFIVDPKKGICGANEIGELIHRGSFVSKGYWENAELTNEKIKPNIHLKQICGNEPVVHSGDLVHMDDDGILWFDGRKDDMLKRSGFRVSPTEIEDILSEMKEAIESIAFGGGNDELGDIISTVVVIENAEINSKMVLDYCRKRMPSYMVPSSVILRNTSFPRTANGKIDRVKIIEQIKVKQLNENS